MSSNGFWKVRTPFWWEKGLVDGRRYGHGMRRKSLGCYSLRRGLRGFRLMGSRICRAVMGLVGLRSRKLEISVNFLKLILGTLPPFIPCQYCGPTSLHPPFVVSVAYSVSIGLICRHTVLRSTCGEIISCSRRNSWVRSRIIDEIELIVVLSLARLLRTYYST